LREGTNPALGVASVIGREFELEVLRRVLAQSDEDLEVALEEAATTAIIEEHSVVGTSITYRFSHAFFRQTLYEEIVAPRRIRLHQQVARALEEVYARRLDEHASALAEHYAFSSDTQDLAKAVYYGELAAQRATDAFAYAEAARQLERALVVQELVDPDDSAKICDLLLALGRALLPVGETERVITHELRVRLRSRSGSATDAAPFERATSPWMVSLRKAQRPEPRHPSTCGGPSWRVATPIPRVSNASTRTWRWRSRMQPGHRFGKRWNCVLTPSCWPGDLTIPKRCSEPPSGSWSRPDHNGGMSGFDWRRNSRVGRATGSPVGH
jgi:hypothetical protein